MGTNLGTVYNFVLQWERKTVPKPQKHVPKDGKREREPFPMFPTETIVQLNGTYLMKVSILLRKFAKSNNKPKNYFRFRDGKKDLKPEFGIRNML